MKRKLFFSIAGLLILSGLVIASFSAPFVVILDPAQANQTVTFNAPFTIQFSHMMNKASVERAFSVAPAVKGHFEWKDARTLEFHPSSDLTIGDEYRVRVDGSAKSLWLKAIQLDTELNFLVTGPPFVLFAYPEDGKMLPLNGIVTVMFDRAMDFDSLSQDELIESDPKLKGSIRTLGQSAFQFIPVSLEAESEYHFRIPAGLSSVDGGQTEEAFEWTLSTPSISVISSMPAEKATDVDLNAPLEIQFDEAVELDQIRPGVNALLYPSNDLDADISERRDGFFNTEVTYGEDKNTLIFSPTFPYQAGLEYEFVLKSDDSLSLEQDFELTFQTASNALPEAETVTQEEVAQESPATLAWEDGNEMTFFVQGEHPRLRLKQQLDETAYMTVCPVPSNEFIRIRASGGFENYRCKDTDPETLDPSKKDLGTLFNLNDYFRYDWTTGVYFASIETENERIWKVFFMQDTSLLLKKSAGRILVWANDVKTGKPIPDMELEFLSFDGTLLGRGETDETGLFTADESYDDGLYVRAKKEVNGENLRWGLVSDRWLFTGYLHDADVSSRGIHLILNQSVLAPGDLLAVKGIWREIEDSALTLPKAAQVTVTLEDELQNLIVDQRVPLRRNGSFDTSIQIPPGTSDGVYQLYVSDLNHQLLSGPYRIKVREEAASIALEWVKADSYHAQGTTPTFIVKGWVDGGIPASRMPARYRLYRTPFRDRYQEGPIQFTFNPLLSKRDDFSAKREFVYADSFELDVDGEAQLHLTDGKSGFLNEGYQYELEISATDAQGRTAQLGTRFQVGQGEFRLGLGVRHAILELEEDLEVSLVALTDGDDFLKGQKVSLQLVPRDQTDHPVYRETVSTEDAPLKISIPRDPRWKAGRYLLRAVTEDERKNEIVSEKEIYVMAGGDETLGDSFILAVDQPKYFVGGRAHLLIYEPTASESPMSVLLSYEREGLLGYQLLTLEKPITRVSIPIEENMVPYFDVKVTRFNRGLNPYYSQSNLTIEAENDRDKIFVDMDLEPSEPKRGENLTVRLHTYDFQNEPVSAVLTMNVLKGLGLPMDFSSMSFFGASSDSVSSASNHLLEEPQFIPSSDPRSSSLFFDETSSIYFNPLITTDSVGEASVQFTLPESAKDLSFQVLAARGPKQFGHLERKISLDQRLSIRPIVPNFAVPGDQTIFGAFVKNVSDQPISTRLEFLSEQATVQGDASRNISLQPGQHTEIFFSAYVNSVIKGDEIAVTLRSGQDLSRAHVPVKRLLTSVDLVENGRLEDLWSGRVILPSGAVAEEEEIWFTLGSSPLVITQNDQHLLDAYPYPSIELLASRVILNLNEGEPVSVRPELSALQKQMDFEGAYAYWKGARPSAFLSSKVLMAYYLAREAGNTVEDSKVTQTLEFLLNELNSGTVRPEDQSFVLWILGLYGQYDTSFSLNLYQERESLPLAAQAFLLLNMEQLAEAGQKSVSPYIEILKSEVADSAEKGVSLYDEAVSLYALSELGSDNSLLSALVDRIYSLREAPLQRFELKSVLWVNMALSSYKELLPEQDINYIVQLKLNGKTLIDQSVTGQTDNDIFDVSADSDALNTDAYNDIFVKKEGAGPLYFDAHLITPLESKEMRPIEDGIVIVRTLLELKDDESLVPVSSLRKTGRYLSKIEIVVPEDMNQVVVTDPLPAGVKPVSGEINELLAPFSSRVIEDDRLIYYAESLPAGVYTLETRLQATLSGSYHHFPATIRSLQNSEIWGNSAGALIQILE